MDRANSTDDEPHAGTVGPFGPEFVAQLSRLAYRARRCLRGVHRGGHGLHVLLDVSASIGCGKSVAALRLTAALGYLALSSQEPTGVSLLGASPGGWSFSSSAAVSDPSSLTASRPGTSTATGLWPGLVESPESSLPAKRVENLATKPRNTSHLAGTVGPLRGVGAAHRLLGLLERVQFGGVMDLQRSVEAFARAKPVGTVVLISDFLVDVDVTPALDRLRRTGVHLVAIQLLSASERDPPLGRERRLVDSETGQELLITVTERLRAAYLARLDARVAGLHQSCRERGYGFVSASASSPLETILFGNHGSRGALELIGSGAQRYDRPGRR